MSEHFIKPEQTAAPVVEDESAPNEADGDLK